MAKKRKSAPPSAKEQAKKGVIGHSAAAHRQVVKRQNASANNDRVAFEKANKLHKKHRKAASDYRVLLNKKKK